MVRKMVKGVKKEENTMRKIGEEGEKMIREALKRAREQDEQGGENCLKIPYTTKMEQNEYVRA